MLGMVLPLKDDGTGTGWVPEDSFGARLALVRQHHGWNVKQAAEACGINVESWRLWETRGRKPRDLYEAVEKIARVAGCNELWLLAGDAAVPRSRCFSPLSLVDGPEGQLELSFDAPPELVTV